MKVTDQHFAEQFARERAAAETHLWRQMQERGMTREGGWKIAEHTRDTRGGTELVLRPMHLWHDSPYDLECVVWVQEDDGIVEASCTPEPLRRDPQR
jgi:hypothetical protein